MNPDSPTRLCLDGRALTDNWRFLKTQSGLVCGAAVKADGYGLGAREVVMRLRDAGCRDFFVAHWGEAAAIANLVPPEQIAVLNGIEADDIGCARAIGAIPVLNTPRQIALWKAEGGGRAHVMLDSGINRLGIGPEQFSTDMFRGLDIDVLMSHLASADEDVQQNEQQLALFHKLSSQIVARRRSLANSAGIVLGSNYHFDLTRPGLSIYGGIPHKQYSSHIRPVAHLSARLLQVRDLQTGEPVGYNSAHICRKPTRVGTLSIGYADGYAKSLSGKGTVLADGCILPVIGRVSMDMITVDLTATNDVGEGDWVDIAFDLPEASRISGRSQYELLTNLGKRFDRRWM